MPLPPETERFGAADQMFTVAGNTAFDVVLHASRATSGT